MKRVFAVLLGICLIFSCAALAACNRDKGENVQVTYYTVKFVDISDSSILKEEKVKSGEKVKDWDPKKDGYTFIDWYATPDMLHEFNFDVGITKDTTVYGYFALDQFEEDVRSFYVLGQSSDEGSVLFNTNWKIGDEAKQKLTKADKEGVNEYSITLDLYVGDMFQLAINNNFENQRGFGYFDSEAAEGYFEINANFLDPNPRKANIVVSKAGNYTLTLTTHPWSDEYETAHESYTEEKKENYNYNVQDTLTFVHNGDPIVAPSDEALEIHVKGSYITGWEHFTTPEYTMVYDEERDVYTYSHEFVAGDSFMFYNFVKVDGSTTLGSININSDRVDTENSDVEHLTLATGANIGVKDSGTYSFEYDRNTNKITVKYDDKFENGYAPGDTWYISGSGITEPLKSSQFGNNLTNAQKFTKASGENTYTMTLDLARGDMFQVIANKWYAAAHNYSDIKEPVREEKTYFTQAGDNVRVEISGNYTLTLKLDSQSPVGDVIEWVRNGDIQQELPIAFDVFMKCSSINNWAPSERNSTVEGVVEFRALLGVGDQFCFIYYEPGVPDEEIGSHNNPGALITGLMKGTSGSYNDNFSVEENNFVCEQRGFYVIRIDFTNGSPVVDFTGYQEAMPEFEVLIKGNAIEEGWSGTDRVPSQDGKVEMTVTFIKTGETTPSDGEFGLTWYGEGADPTYGNYLGWSSVGTSGNANSNFVQQNGGNNIVCMKAGTYKVVVDLSSGQAVVDFYTI